MAMSVVYTTLGGRVVYENRGGTERSYLRDPLGNTVGLMDMSGTVTDTYDYWPYGEERVHTGSSITPLTFLGTLGYFKDFLNMLYVRARHLRGDLTRWLTIDRLWPLTRPYTYASSAPTMRADPSGAFDVAPVYGNYCGPQSGVYAYPPCDHNRPDPVDCLDTCCQQHDDCFGASNCTLWNQLFSLDCRLCTCLLCACAARCNCGWSLGCNIMQTIILDIYACNLLFGGGPFCMLVRP